MSRRSLRYLLLAALVVMQAATLISVYLWSRWRSEAVLRTHLTELVEGIAAGSAERTDAFLQRAEGALGLTADLVAGGVLDLSSEAEAERYFLSLLEERADLAGIFVGHDDGRFLFVTRSEDGYLTKSITVDDQRVVTLIDRAADLAVTDQRVDPDDAYDPTARPWFIQARADDGLIWTSPYVFFTSRLPGVTAARPLVTADGSDAGVLGVDVTLERVADFLELIPVTDNGEAFVVGQDGSIVAYPADADLAVPREDADGFRLRQVDEIDSPVVRAAYAAAIADPRATVAPLQIELGGAEHLVQLREVESPVGWSVGVVAPEGDLIGAIQDDRDDAVLIAVAVALGVTLLAVPLIFGLTRPHDTLREHATTDSLTSLPNRRTFFDEGDDVVQASLRSGAPLAVAMVDLDRFKKVNDRFGHAAGDSVLRIVAGRIRGQLRPDDLVGRYGGEEFAIVMPKTSASEALAVVDRVRRDIAAEPVHLEDGSLVEVTISAGVADGDPDLMSLLRAADMALLAAKAGGRNRVELGEASGPGTPAIDAR